MLAEIYAAREKNLYKISSKTLMNKILERDPEKDADYSYIGHYLNMRSTKYTKVACGFATSSDGKTGWLNINFF